MTSVDVYLEGVDTPVGELSSDPDKGMSFRYVRDDLPHPISMSLPVREAPYDDVAARGFFANLLFENEMRDQVMQRHGLAERDIVGLLYHLGADCPGAISCVPKGAPPGKRPGNMATDYDALCDQPIVPDAMAALSGYAVPPDSRLARVMLSLRDHRRMPPDTNDPSPLAGVQGKIAVTLLPDGRLALPRKGSGAPTTHILKVPRAAEMARVGREHLAMQMMGKIQSYSVARTCVLGEGDLFGLLVERFDRVVTDGQVSRLHQEDFCQALGLGHQLKYERNGTPERKFSARAVGKLLQNTALPGQARMAFFEITVANMLLGNADNHAKNHAMLYRGPKPELAPAYDIDPVLLDDVNHEMGFLIGSARVAEDVTKADLVAFLGDIGYPRPKIGLLRLVLPILTAAVERVEKLPGGAAKRLRDVVYQQASHLSHNLDLGVEIPEGDLVLINR